LIQKPQFTFEAAFGNKYFFHTQNNLTLMKKAIFFLSFFFVLGIAAANAQCSGATATASKSCCANKAAKLAAADATIEKRQAEDGTVSYVRKEVDAQGNVQFVSLQFDEKTNTFVNAAPKSATIAADDKAAATKKAACTTSEKKACAASAGSGKACCASKTAKTSTTAVPEQK
jgi:hypothetical protein